MFYLFSISAYTEVYGQLHAPASLSHDSSIGREAGMAADRSRLWGEEENSREWNLVRSDGMSSKQLLIPVTGKK